MFWASFNAGRRRSVWALALVALVAGCARPEAGKTAPLKTASDWFVIKVGDQMVHMQLAVYPAEMEHGLMERRDLGSDQGMLFVYAEPTAMGFWMRNTPLPLDIGYFNSAGELLEIYAMYPFDETPIHSRNGRLQFALEMNQGWYRGRGVRPGAKLDMTALRAALTARGLTPADFGLR